VSVITSPNAVSGQFAQTTTVLISGQSFTINYANGAGGTNVALVRTPTTWIWDGGGTDNNWTTAANWTADAGSPGAGRYRSNSPAALAPARQQQCRRSAARRDIFQQRGKLIHARRRERHTYGRHNQQCRRCRNGRHAHCAGGDQTFNAASGKMTFGTSATLDGDYALTLTGSGGLTFNAAIGGGTALNAINADTSMAANAAVNAISFTTVSQPYSIALKPRCDNYQRGDVHEYRRRDVG